MKNSTYSRILLLEKEKYIEVTIQIPGSVNASHAGPAIDDLQPIKDWCIDHCQFNWRIKSVFFIYGRRTGVVEFESRSDAAFFALTWG